MKAFTVAAFATIAALGSTDSNPATFNGFAKTCVDVDVIWDKHKYLGMGGSAMLQARCKFLDRDGYAWSELDLNHCFGWNTNDCTYFFPPGSANFTDNCYGYDWNGATLAPRCKCWVWIATNGGQNMNYTLLPMDDYVGNDNGTLAC